jgi:thiamine-phosphate pyrophosphorylase
LKLVLPKLYPITSRDISGLSHLEQVRRFIDGGAEMIQLRDKDAPAGELYAAALESVKYAHRHGVRILINDRVDIALATGADGVHLGQDDLPPGEARKILGDDAMIGFSTHTGAEARAALDLPIDYIAVGPVFETLTKCDPDPVVGLDGLRAVRAVIGKFPLVAIGGIDLENAQSVLDAGADSLAVIRDLLADPSAIVGRTLAFTGR